MISRSLISHPQWNERKISTIIIIPLFDFSVQESIIFTPCKSTEKKIFLLTFDWHSSSHWIKWWIFRACVCTWYEFMRKPTLSRVLDPGCIWIMKEFNFFELCFGKNLYRKRTTMSCGSGQNAYLICQTKGTSDFVAETCSGY